MAPNREANSDPQKTSAVLADVDGPASTPAVPGMTKNVVSTGKRVVEAPNVVNKVPAPRPVELPTAQDIMPMHSPPDSAHSSFDEDLESGRSPGMREILRGNAQLVLSAQRSKGSPIPSPEVIEVNPISTAEIQSLSTSTGKPSLDIELPDLLADSAPVMDTKPIDPSSPSSMHSERSISRAGSAFVEHDTIMQVQSTAVMRGENGPDPDSTIRLVGGGGVVGTSKAAEAEEINTDNEADTDNASVTPIASEPEQTKKHKKTKSSLSSLKKLGHLGVLRKRGSSSTIKTQAAPPVAS